jgi:hypothetical protein
MEKFIKLKDVTFIVPVKIESSDREFNFLRVIQYLCDKFETNIIISEADSTSKVKELLKRIDKKKSDIIHFYEQTDSEVFHRTRLLNEMLLESTTPITVNYDIDVLLLPEAYLRARDMIIHEGYDLVYPYRRGGDGQVQISYPNRNNYKGENLFNPEYYQEWGTLCGHVQFFKTSSYINGGMENEDFMSYGAEDRERMNRFIRFGYKVDWIDEFQVYHLEHSRGINSSTHNPSYHANESLYNKLNNMETEEMVEYYKNVEYLKKYSNAKG